jgi:hypothetical protein
MDQLPEQRADYPHTIDAQGIQSHYLGEGTKEEAAEA